MFFAWSVVYTYIINIYAIFEWCDFGKKKKKKKEWCDKRSLTTLEVNRSRKQPSINLYVFFLSNINIRQYTLTHIN